jgi:hypothetical protein
MAYRKAGKTDSNPFFTSLVPERADLVESIREYPLEDTDSTQVGGRAIQAPCLWYVTDRRPPTMAR